MTQSDELMSCPKPSYENERALLVKEVGECCRGSDPFCAAGCLVEKAIRKRADRPTPKPAVDDAELEQILKDAHVMHYKRAIQALKHYLHELEEELAAK